MPDIFVPTGEVKFSEKLVNGRYPVKVPSFMDVHEWWGNWETERYKSMESLLKPGMVLYDVGAFDGWQSVILSRFVGGGKNMVLIEPVAENWPNIKATWEANKVETPLATYMGFIGPETSNMPSINSRRWPSWGVDYSKAIAVTKFKHLNENAATTPSLSFDDLVCRLTGPDAINIDVEGAELIVLQSAEKILKVWKPIVWLSVHPEFMRERYGHKPEQVKDFFHLLGYRSEFLGNDHEEHWIYRPL